MEVRIALPLSPHEKKYGAINLSTRIKKDDAPGRLGLQPVAHRLICERLSLPVNLLSAQVRWDFRK